MDKIDEAHVSYTRIVAPEWPMTLWICVATSWAEGDDAELDASGAEVVTTHQAEKDAWAEDTSSAKPQLILDCSILRRRYVEVVA